ncbi:MAG: ribose 5-phosphate isomerase B [Candidatus Diapherotrites archaeon CG08_land_8_20_14_0_20_30_16]|nr:MAG: ribose 5-phosphate isomerase B [Candidatus Diapherotrites archaeon CG08_land_8_20_14_0_20_30_16]
MTIYIASDHGGFKLKEKIKNHLVKKGFEIKDFGTHSEDSVDYPIFAKKVSNAVTKDSNSKGILVCGTGIGMSIAANKIKGIRAALCWNEETARLSREHNDTNVLCFGQRILGEDLVLKIVDVWLNTKFTNEERHIRRLDMLD